jgi:uncharacterized protein (TIGR02147 family)
VSSLSPLTFKSARDYLQAVFAERKSQNPRYSIRAWSKRLGYENPSLLSDVLNGRRRMNSELRGKIGQNLQLTGPAREYFDLLCLMGDAKSERDRSFYLEKTLALNPQMQTATVDLDSFLTIKDWYNLTILEMIDMEGFEEDYSLIAKMLGDGVNRTMVRDAIKRLLRLRLLTRDKNGKLKKPVVHVNVGNHLQFIEKAKQSIYSQSFNDRDTSGSTVAIRADKIDEVKKLIDKFHDDLHQIASRPAANGVYRINIQMFKLTQEEFHEGIS